MFWLMSDRTRLRNYKRGPFDLREQGGISGGYMSILDTGDIASSAITGFSQNPIANLSSGVGEAGIASLVEFRRSRIVQTRRRIFSLRDAESRRRGRPGALRGRLVEGLSAGARQEHEIHRHLQEFSRIDGGQGGGPGDGVPRSAAEPV